MLPAGPCAPFERRVDSVAERERGGGPGPADYRLVSFGLVELVAGARVGIELIAFVLAGCCCGHQSRAHAKTRST